MTATEADRAADLRVAASGTPDAREFARHECRQILAAGSGSLAFLLEIRRILSTIGQPEPPTRQDRAAALLLMKTKLLELRGSPLGREVASELAELADAMSGQVSPEEREVLSLWLNRPELFSARRWRALMNRMRVDRSGK
jgi:hypothetical protein